VLFEELLEVLLAELLLRAVLDEELAAMLALVELREPTRAELF